MKKQSGIVWLPLLIMIVAVAAFATAALIIYRANQPIAHTNTNVATNMADWETYTDLEGKYSLRYPVGWITYEAIEGGRDFSPQGAQ